MAHTTSTTTGTRTSFAARATDAAPVLLSVLRIGGGLLFMQHGAQKLFGLFGGQVVELVSLMGLAGVLEFFGGLLIVLGLLTRPVAILLVIEMLVAYFKVHIPQSAVPIENGGELALLYALVFALLAAAGPGRLSIDRRFGWH